MRWIYIVSGIFIAFVCSVTLAAQHQASGAVPPAYVRPAPAEVRAWEVKFALADGPGAALGPVRPQAGFDPSLLDAFGTPDGTQANPKGDQVRHFYALGTYIKAYGPHKDGKMRARIVLGNPFASSAEDPIVKACPFTFEGGIRFGMSPKEVKQRMLEIHPAMVGGGSLDSDNRKYRWWQMHLGGFMVTGDFGVLCFMNGQLVAVELL